MIRATITRVRFATVDELFRYKDSGFTLPPFPGNTGDQWGIKAHNRPWIEEAGRFTKGERIIEIGGAYSTLPEYLAAKYGTESWIGDDFGAYTEDKLWTRWGDPDEWIRAHPAVRYVRKPLGFFAEDYPTGYFDCVFSVSTLEHIPRTLWTDVVRDMLRITKPGGRQLHSIDIMPYSPAVTMVAPVWSRIPLLRRYFTHPMLAWKSAFRKAGVRSAVRWPRIIESLDRRNLAESYDVVHRFYPRREDGTIRYAGGNLSLLVELRRDA